MKTMLFILCAATFALAQTQTKSAALSASAPIIAPATEAPIPRETQLELQLIAQRETEIQKALEGFYAMLIAPVTEKRSDAVKRACELVGIPAFGPDGKPACEIKDGKVRKIAPVSAPAPPGKEK
jgi:hypothetical protein